MSVSKTSKLLQYINYRECRCRRLCMMLPATFLKTLAQAHGAAKKDATRNSRTPIMAESYACRHACDDHGWQADGGQVSAACGFPQLCRV